MKALIVIVMACFVIVMTGWPAHAENLIFGLLGKSIDDSNFIDAASGCQEAADLAGDRCIHIGGHGPAAARLQVKAFSKAVQTGKYSGMAISVILSDVLARVIRESVSFPVITFDSPFASPDADVSLAYVGTDNVAFGHDLARIVKAFRPNGGTVFLMGDMHDTNLAQRILGVRRELSGRPSFKPDQRLKGEGRWFEFERSPWNSRDTISQSLDQMRFMLENKKPQVFISVGHWPVIDPEAYRKAVQPFYHDIVNRKTLMVAGVGKVTPGIRALLNEGLVHGLVSIDFVEIGRQAYGVMRDLNDGRSVPEETFIPNKLLFYEQDSRE